MIYTGFFQSQDNIDYRVTITTQSGGTTPANIELGGDEPVKIKQKGGSFFEPLKLRGATVTIVSGSYFFDIYSPTPQGTEVKIEKKKNSTWITVFRGYATPCVYNQDYRYLQEIEIEAVEALSTLEYFDYQPLSGESKIVTFYSILKKLINEKCGYRYLHISDDTANILNLSISEENFMDDDGEWVDSGDTVIYRSENWKCNEVLEEFCRYFNLTCTVYNDEVYMVNYANLTHYGNYSHTRYDFNNNTSTHLTYTHNYPIGVDSFMGEGAEISLSEVTNKVAVECNEYEVDDEDFCPDFFDNALLQPWAVNRSGIWTPYPRYERVNLLLGSTGYTFYYIEYRHRLWKTYNYGKPSQKMFFKKLFTGATDDRQYIRYLDYDSIYNMIGREQAPWYESYRYDQLVYNHTGGDVWDNVMYAGDYQQAGATVVRYFRTQNTELIPSSANWEEAVIFSLGLPQAIFNERLAGGSGYPPSTKEQLDDLNTFHRTTNAIFAEYTLGSEMTYGSATEDTYLVINGSVRYDMFWQFPTDFEGDNLADYAKEYKAIEGGNATWSYPTIQMQIQIGDYYYNGAAAHWDGDTHYWVDGGQWSTDSNSHFYVCANKGDNLVYNTWMSVYNTVQFDYNIDKAGYAIQIPQGLVMKGKMIIRFFCPYLYEIGKDRRVQIGYPENYITKCVPRWVAMKDFSIGYATPSGQWYDLTEEQKDTTYENVVNGEYVDNDTTVKIKINTQVKEKKPSYSSVYSGDTYITALHSNVLNKTQKQEYNIIEQQVNHYSTPKIELEAKLKNNVSGEDVKPYTLLTYPTLSGSKKYVVDESNLNLKTNTNKLTIKEY